MHEPQCEDAVLSNVGDRHGLADATANVARASDLFGPRAAAYDAWYRSAAGRLVLQAEVRALQAALPPIRERRVLEVGMGTGAFARVLRDVGANVVGLDASAEMLAEATRHAPLRCVQGDGSHLPFADSSFDVTFAMTVLEFMPDAAAAVAEMRRVTRPGGTIAVGVLNAHSLWAWVRRRRADPVYAAAHTFTARELSDLLCTCGVPRIRYVVHFPDRPLRLATLMAQAEPRMAGVPGAALLLGCVTVNGSNDSEPTGGDLRGRWTA